MLANENKIVMKVRQSDPESFKVLFDHYYPKLYSFLKSFVKNTNEVENLIQDVFLSIWEYRFELNENLSFSSLLFKTAKNKALNHLRKSVNNSYYIEYCQIFSSDEDNATENFIDHSDRMAILEKYIGELPDRRQEIFLCSFKDGLSYREIAEKLQITENTVDSQLRNALNYLKSKVKEKI